MRTLQEYYTNLNNSYDQKEKVLRSSAIFPCLVSNKINTELIFLNYWALKRQINDLNFLLTIRSKKGNILNKKYLDLSKIKAYRISIKKELRFHKYLFKKFNGSVEIEITSNKNLFFAYPAITVVLTSSTSSHMVHSCGRTFNDNVDKQKAMKYHTPETGFDIINNSNSTPFFSFVNGPKFIKKKIFKY